MTSPLVPAPPSQIGQIGQLVLSNVKALLEAGVRGEGQEALARLQVSEERVARHPAPPGVRGGLHLRRESLRDGLNRRGHAGRHGNGFRVPHGQHRTRALSVGRPGP